MKQAIIILLCLMAFPALGATCKISEYKDLVRDSNGELVPVANEPALAVQNVTFTTTTQSAAFNASTKFIRVICDAKAHFEVGTNPTAAATDPYLPADTAEYFGIGFQSAITTYEIAFYDGSS